MPNEGEGGPSQVFQRAMAHMRAGRFREAKADLEQVLRKRSDHAQAVHFMGVIAHAEGDAAHALPYLEKAVAMDDGVYFFHGNLAEAYRSLGRHGEAIDHCRRGIALDPHYPEALNTLGAALHAQGQLAQAEIELRQAIEMRPEFAAAYGNLGNVLRAQGKLEAAIQAFARAVDLQPRMIDAYLALGSAFRALDCYDEAADTYRQAVEINPASVQCWFNLGATLRKLDRTADALECFQKAVACRPDMAEAHIALGRSLHALGDSSKALACFDRAHDLNRESAEAEYEKGCVFQDQGRWQAAESAYRGALALRPDFHEAQNNLGRALLAQGRYEEGQRAFWQAMQSRFGEVADCAEPLLETRDEAPDDRNPTRRITRFQILDRQQQLRHLLDLKLVEQSFNRLVERYRSVVDDFGDEAELERRSPLTADQAERIGSSLHKVIHYEDAPRLAGPAVNPNLDFEAIEQNYLSSTTPAVYFDDFLTPDALRGLWRFCRESTIYFGSDPSGFVASQMSDGFNCSLMYQIAEEVKQGFPRILGPHHLSDIWSYRYKAASAGVVAHTDLAAVTFNFWITPDEANLDPDSGGLIVYKSEPLPGWDWKVINTQKNLPEVQDRIQRHLEGAEQIVIPYRENWAVLFHSNLFHKSDALRFKEGFETRRINISLLFGHRGDGDPAGGGRPGSR